MNVRGEQPLAHARTTHHQFIISITVPLQFKLFGLKINMKLAGWGSGGDVTGMCRRFEPRSTALISITGDGHVPGIPIRGKRIRSNAEGTHTKRTRTTGRAEQVGTVRVDSGHHRWIAE